MECVSGTFREVLMMGLYSLQSCLISGYFFLVSYLMFLRRMMAIVSESGCSLRMGI